MLRQRLILAALVAGKLGCVETGTVVCGDGRVCGAGQLCEETHHLCLSDDQLHACDALDAGASCLQNGTCIDGLCLVAVCGDGVFEGNEQCERDDLRGVHGCLDLGYYEDGPVTCASDCTYDRGMCGSICGDGVVDAPHESCDSAPGVVVAQCDDQQIGFYDPGDVTCNAACQFNTTTCTGSCGDGVTNGAEVCDGSPPGIGCLGYGFDYGALGCANCGPEFSGCGTIGWRDEQFQPIGAPGGIMGRAANDIWVSFNGSVVRYLDHEARKYVTPDNAWGSAIWVQANELFLAGDTAIGHGVIGTNGDVTWDSMSLPGASFLSSKFSGVGTNDLYVAGTLSNGAIVVDHYDGSAWSAVGSAGPVTSVINGFWAANASEMWISTVDNFPISMGSLYHWTGSSWGTAVTQPSGVASTTSKIRAIWGADSTHVFIAGDLGVAMWNGATWTVQPTGGAINALHGTSALDVVAAGAKTWRFDGATWSNISGSGPAAVAVWLDGAGVHELCQSLVRFNEGSAWQPAPVSTAGISIWAGNDTVVVATTTPAVLVRNSTGTYVDTAFPSSSYPGFIWGFTPSDFWALGPASVYQYDGTWNDRTANLGTLSLTSPRTIWGASSSDLWIGDNNLALAHWNGSTWAKTSIAQTPWKLHGLAGNDIWLATSGDIVKHYDGSTWSDTTVPSGNAIFDVFEIAHDQVYAAGSGGTIAFWDGIAWKLQVSESQNDITHIWGTSASDMFAADNVGQLLHFDGILWRRVRTPDGSHTSGLTGDAHHVYTLGPTGIDSLFRSAVWD